MKTAEHGGERGHDGAKEVNGRKRHLLVDTKGSLLSVKVHSAGSGERDGAKLLLAPIKRVYSRLQLLWADAGYLSQTLSAWINETLGVTLQIVEQKGRWEWHPEGVEPPAYPVGVQILPGHWIVERTLAWLGRNRRLAKEVERLTETSETLIYAAMVRRMLRRLTRVAGHF